MPTPNFSLLLGVIDFSKVVIALLSIFAALVAVALVQNGAGKLVAFVSSEYERKHPERDFQRRFAREERARVAKRERSKKDQDYKNWKAAQMGPRMPRGRKPTNTGFGTMPKGRWRGLDW